jgi:glutathione S-transferase
MQKLELISHPLCPFNQRLIITLLMKGKKRDHDFSVKYFDLANIPEWFKTLSPRGEMPVLTIDDQKSLFNTNPINEFLNEHSSGDLHSDNIVEKAEDRYWVEYSGEILNLLKGIFTSNQVDLFDQSVHQLFDLFEPIEKHLDQRSSYWRNQHHTLVDGAFIPVFTLMFHFDYFKNHSKWNSYQNTLYWAKRLLSTPLTENSKCVNFNQEFEHFFSFTNSSFKEFTKK